MKKVFLLLILSSLSILAWSQIRLSGYVIDVFTKTPLSKAIVTVNGSDNTLITDAEGYFTVVLKESGVFDVEVSKNGYKSLVESFMLNESIELQIMLTSNAGTAEPVYATNTPKTTTNNTVSNTTKVTNEVKSKKSKNEKETAVTSSFQVKNTPKEKTEKTSKVKPEKVEKIKEEKIIVKNDIKLTKTNEVNTKIEKDEIEKETKTVSLQEQQKKENKVIEKVVAEKSIINESEKVIVTGTVRDAYTKQTISDATILFKGYATKCFSDASGNFYVQIPQNKYFMVVKKEGYQSVSDSISFLANLDLDIFLTAMQDTPIHVFTTEDVIISRTKATDYTPTTFQKINIKDIAENNLGKDLPFLLELSPSVVATSDGGSGVGYTSMRVRGSDITRINFTLNGFPVNDAESQGVFLVNTPDLASSADEIQLQRGIGTSTNGAGAFGASVNIFTNKINSKAYAHFDNAFGSFNTFKNTVKIGSGELFKHFAFEGRFSHIATDGYIDRAAAKLFAYTLSGTYFNKNSTIQFNVFSGFEKTYQAWNGVDYATMQNDRKYNSSGTDYGQLSTPYNNEIDNYRQDNYQLSFTHKFGKYVTGNLGFHYTKGKGYFEQYKVNQDLLDYGIITPSPNTDLVRRRWLNNDFFGSIFSLNLTKGKINTTLGAAWNQYDGDHYGEVIWAKDAQNLNKDEIYYFNNGLKTDFNTFLKAEYKVLKRLVLFADVQYRRVSYTAEGIDNDQRTLVEDIDYNFVNPKAGLTILLGKNMKSQLYTSFAMANREPTRNDFIDNVNTPKAENLMDVELGFRHQGTKFSYEANAFYMKYKNQLVLTGELNDVGSAVRANVDNSYRTGLELNLAYEPIKYFGIKAAGAWSLNEIDAFSFTNYLGNLETHDKTKIAYSPWLVANATLYSKPFKGFEIALINKYVSEQFLDNTNNKRKILNPYFLNDARISYVIHPKFMQEIGFIFKVNNILNVKYASNGYVYYDTPYFYPQAGTNFEGGINLKF